MDFQEFYLQAYYRYRHNIGYLSSVVPSEEIQTAQVDEHANVEISPKFYEDFIKTPEDMAFILGHESAHKNVNVILASDFELNWRYSILIQRGYSDNFLSDLFINQMLFHAIPSTVCERYYATCEDPILMMLQRSIKLLKECPAPDDVSQSKLKLFLLACTHWYKNNEIQLLYEVFKAACDYLSSIPPPPKKENGKGNQMDDQLMVQHKKGESDEEDQEIQDSSYHTRDSELKESKYKLRIPGILELADNLHIDPSVYNQIQSFNELVESQIAKLPIYFGEKRTIGYADPAPEELVSWALEQYVPWTEPIQSMPVQKVVLIFDVSGSMFKYLTILFKIKAVLADYLTEFYAFSTFVSGIQFASDHANVYTGLGTSLDCVLELLDKLEPSVVYITTDGDWSLSKKKPPEYLERLCHKHKITIFQQGNMKIPYLPHDLITVIPITTISV
jgi:hypothetical protein